jgi:hypothetical protein
MYNEIIKTIKFIYCSIDTSDGSVHIKWHDIHTKFYKNWFGHSGNIKVVASTIWEAAVLVLLMWKIYDVCDWDVMTYAYQVHNPWFRLSSNVKNIKSTIWEAAVLVLLMRGICDLRYWDGLRWHNIVACSILETPFGLLLRFITTSLVIITNSFTMCSDPLTLRLGAVLWSFDCFWSGLLWSVFTCLRSGLVWSGLLSSTVGRTRRHLLEGFHLPC